MASGYCTRSLRGMPARMPWQPFVSNSFDCPPKRRAARRCRHIIRYPLSVYPRAGVTAKETRIARLGRDPKSEGRNPNLAKPEPKRREIFGRNILWQEDYRKPTGEIRPRSEFREVPVVQEVNAKTQRRRDAKQ